MKILSIGNFTTGWDGSICDEEHIAQALENLGHKVTRWQRGEIGTFDVPYDFALIAQWDGYGSKLFEMLHEMTGNIVYWAFDYQADGQEWHERLVREADLYLSKRIADSKYPNWRWCSQDFAPEFLTKAPEVNKDIDILFTGTYLPWATERNEILKAVDEKYSLQIHAVNPWDWKAAGFRHVNGPVMDDALPELIARAKINLSIDHTYEAGYWSDRNSQIIACGGFVLFRHVPLSEAIFRSNIAYFWDKEDCLEAIEHWLEQDEAAEMIAAEAYENSVYYKVKERVADMLNIVREIV